MKRSALLAMSLLAAACGGPKDDTATAPPQEAAARRCVVTAFDGPGLATGTVADFDYAVRRGDGGDPANPLSQDFAMLFACADPTTGKDVRLLTAADGLVPAKDLISKFSIGLRYAPDGTTPMAIVFVSGTLGILPFKTKAASDEALREAQRSAEADARLYLDGAEIRVGAEPAVSLKLVSGPPAAKLQPKTGDETPGLFVIEFIAQASDCAAPANAACGGVLQAMTAKSPLHVEVRSSAGDVIVSADIPVQGLDQARAAAAKALAALPKAPAKSQ